MCWLVFICASCSLGKFFGFLGVDCYVIDFELWTSWLACGLGCSLAKFLLIWLFRIAIDCFRINFSLEFDS